MQPFTGGACSILKAKILITQSFPLKTHCQGLEPGQDVISFSIYFLMFGY